MKSEKIDYNYLKNNNLILYEVISGSIAYGTNLPSSDEDRRYVYILPHDYILSGNVIEQVNDDTNDVVGYEIGKFLNLISSANPNILELLNTPEDCIIYKDPIFDLILENNDNFITKTCAKSFGGYAVTQIKKAKGQDKKQNWEKDKITRKDILDFTYVIEGNKSIPWKVWNKDNNYEEKFIGVVNVPNAKDVYALFFDEISYNCFSESISEDFREFQKNIQISKGGPLGLGYKGLIKSDEDGNESNQLRLSSIPKGETAFCNIIYNREGYTQHCKDYKSYQEWLENRNITRYVDVKSHGQKIDGKNMMHCIRLIQMAREIGEGKGINVRRENKDELISIRKGEVDLQTLIDRVESEITEIDSIFEKSNLPTSVDKDLINNLIVLIRKKFYNL